MIEIAWNYSEKLQNIGIVKIQSCSERNNREAIKLMQTCYNF